MLIEPLEELFLDNKLGRHDLWRKLGLRDDVDDRFTVSIFAGSRAGALPLGALFAGCISGLLRGAWARLPQDFAAAFSKKAAHGRAFSPFEQIAFSFGHALGREGWRLVYGAGPSGVMGAAADGALAADATADVFGITLEMFLSKQGNSNEGLHPRIRGNFATKQLSQRKWAMFALADAFVSLPGGFGTLDEAFEAVTLEQLGLHRKQHFFLNAFGYFQPLWDFTQGKILGHGFANADHAALMRMTQTVPDLVRQLHGAHVQRVCLRLCDELCEHTTHNTPRMMREALARIFAAEDAATLSQRISGFIRQEKHFTRLAARVRAAI